MIVLLSPAKSLDWSPVPLELPTTEPRLPQDTAVLMRRCKRLKPRDLSDLMDISDDLAELNHGRFQEMTEALDPERDRPAALAFNGAVYQGLDARSLDADALAWAQDHVAILSGLYGLLRPLDLIQPYRLEMGTPLKTRRGGSLYDFWGDKVTNKLNHQVRAQDDRTVVNLASNEYFKVLHKKKLAGPLLTPVFKEELPDGRLQSISFFAKWARGAMARYVVDQRLETPEGLKDFTGGDYRFQPALSDARTWTFTRPKPPPVGSA
ncbi:MAG: peroxide stress protein YaaA [Alphaproteobacteria bacterium]|nr:peroxide stress protein YaaA [Alphaproteobacteria bacterium]